MKIKKVNYITASVEINMYKRNLKGLVSFYIDSGLLNSFLQEFKKEDIYRAIDSIYYDGSNICTPQDERYSMILRYLQFGGKDLNALCLLSKAAGGVYE